MRRNKVIRELSEATLNSVAISPAEVQFVIEWVVRQVAQTIEHISEDDARAVVMFAVDVARIKSRWGDTLWEPNAEMLEKEGSPALQDAVLAVLAQRGDGSCEPIREWTGSDAQILFVDAFSRLVAVAGRRAVAVEYHRRAKNHELGVDAAVVLAKMNGTWPKGVEDSFRRLFKTTLATFWKFGKGFWEPEFVREENGREDNPDVGEGVPLDAVAMDANSQIPITLHERFGAKRDVSELYALALDGKLDIAPRAIADDLMDQRKHRRLMREKTPLGKKRPLGDETPPGEREDEFLVYFENAQAPADISQPLMEFRKDMPEVSEESLEILISPESRNEMARKLGITPKTATNRRKRAEKALREYLRDK